MPASDERGGWTSASSALEDSLCPGRHLAQHGLPELPRQDWTESGEVIHSLWTGTKPKREATAEEQDKSVEFLTREAEMLHDLDFGQDYARFSETRLWHDFDGLRHSGRFDVVDYDQSTKRMLLLDGKSGWLPVPPPNTNQQLRDLAVLLWLNFGCGGDLLVNIVKPFGRQDRPCLYDHFDLMKAFADMRARVKRSNDPQSPRVPGEVQCRYCRANRTCSEYLGWAGSALPVVFSAPAGLPMAPATDWTPAQRSLFCEREAAARKWLKDRKEEVRELLKADPEAAPGFTLKDGNEPEKITNPTLVYKRFAELGGSQDQFMPAVSVGKGALKDQLREVTGQKGEALTRTLDKLIEGATETKKSEPQIVKVK